MASRRECLKGGDLSELSPWPQHSTSPQLMSTDGHVFFDMSLMNFGLLSSEVWVVREDGYHARGARLSLKVSSFARWPPSPGLRLPTDSKEVARARGLEEDDLRIRSREN